jgi:hypothetical protein
MYTFKIPIGAPPQLAAKYEGVPSPPPATAGVLPARSSTAVQAQAAATGGSARQAI